mmetsp:Transcript_39130/g.63438  ORF Transcript_39130/g.63438 Transcript_39130/m.63438 type:complete len:623 (+) Transcript_39130:100-1968(+)
MHMHSIFVLTAITFGLICCVQCVVIRQREIVYLDVASANEVVRISIANVTSGISFLVREGGLPTAEANSVTLTVGHEFEISCSKAKVYVAAYAGYSPEEDSLYGRSMMANEAFGSFDIYVLRLSCRANSWQSVEGGEENATCTESIHDLSPNSVTACPPGLHMFRLPVPPGTPEFGITVDSSFVTPLFGPCIDRGTLPSYGSARVFRPSSFPTSPWYYLLVNNSGPTPASLIPYRTDCSYGLTGTNCTSPLHAHVTGSYVSTDFVLGANQSSFVSFDVQDGRGVLQLYFEVDQEQPYGVDVLARVGGLPLENVFDHRISLPAAAGSNDYAYEIRFPLVGLWFLEFTSEVGTNVSFIALMGDCPNGCSAKGLCGFEEDEVPHFQCRCFLRYNSADCSQDAISPSFFYFQVFCLTASNLAMVPAIIVSRSRKLLTEMWLYILTMTVSIAYHFCDMDVACFGASFDALQFFDFFLSLTAFSFSILCVANIPRHIIGSFHFLFLVITVFVVEDARSSHMLQALSVGSACLVLVFFLFQNKGTHGLFWGLDRKMAVRGLGTGGIGLSSLLLLRPQTYWFFHSVWHVTIMLAPCFIIRIVPDQRTLPHEVPDEEDDGHTRPLMRGEAV